MYMMLLNFGFQIAYKQETDLGDKAETCGGHIVHLLKNMNPGESIHLLSTL